MNSGVLRFLWCSNSVVAYPHKHMESDCNAVAAEVGPLLERAVIVTKLIILSRDASDNQLHI
jgi:hypothetical protein